MRVDRTFNIFQDNILNFIVNVKDSNTKAKFMLNRSHDALWINPGEPVIKAVDDGNSITIGNTELSYSEFDEVFCLMLTIIKSKPNNWPVTKVYRETSNADEYDEYIRLKNKFS